MSFKDLKTDVLNKLPEKTVLFGVSYILILVGRIWLKRRIHQNGKNKVLLSKALAKIWMRYWKVNGSLNHVYFMLLKRDFELCISKATIHNIDVLQYVLKKTYMHIIS